MYTQYQKSAAIDILDRVTKRLEELINENYTEGSRPKPGYAADLIRAQGAVMVCGDKVRREVTDTDTRTFTLAEIAGTLRAMDAPENVVSHFAQYISNFNVMPLEFKLACGYSLPERYRMLTEEYFDA